MEIREGLRGIFVRLCDSISRLRVELDLCCALYSALEVEGGIHTVGRCIWRYGTVAIGRLYFWTLRNNVVLETHVIGYIAFVHNSSSVLKLGHSS